MTKRIWIPIVTLAFVTTFGCKKEETVSPDDAAADDSDDDAEEEPEPEPEEPEEDVPAIMTKASFDDSIHAHFDDVTNCYLSALEGNAKLEGTFSAVFTFDAEGGVTEVTVAEGSTLNDEGLTTCVANAAKGWTFDRPNEAGMTMRYDYNLAPAE